MLDLFMFTDILISYCDNKMIVNYNTILNTVKDLDANDIINRCDILLSLTDPRVRTIKMYVGRPSIKNNIRYDYTTLYEIRIKLLSNNSGDCIVKSVSIKDD